MNGNEKDQDLFPRIDPIGNIENVLDTVEVFPQFQEKEMQIESFSEDDLKRKKWYDKRGPLRLNWWKETGKIYEQQINEACLLIKYITLYSFGDIIQMAVYMKEIYSVERPSTITFDNYDSSNQLVST